MTRWRLSDWPLLVVRVLILATAAAAWAAPVVVAPAQREQWRERMARAIVLVPPAPLAATGDRQQLASLVREESSTYAHTVLEGGSDVRDRIGDAIAWLERQPPSRRELLIAGDLREGLFDAGDLARVPPLVGIRLRPVPPTGDQPPVRLAATTEGAGGVIAAREILAHLTHDVTTATTAAGEPAAIVAPLRARAAADEQPLADALVRAVLAEGVRLPRASQRAAIVEFDGSPATAPTSGEMAAWMGDAIAALGSSGRVEQGVLVVDAGLRASDPRAAGRLWEIAAAVFHEDLSPFEIRRLDNATLAAWSRPAGDVPLDARPVDEGDRRYLWLAVIGLLAMEHWLRHGKSNTRRATRELVVEERVA
jgi:hypothetical protein